MNLLLMYGPRAARLGRYLRLHIAACFSSSRVWSTTSNSSAHFPPVSKRARKVSPGVVPACVGPPEGGRSDTASSRASRLGYGRRPRVGLRRDRPAPRPRSSSVSPLRARRTALWRARSPGSGRPHGSQCNRTAIRPHQDPPTLPRAPSRPSLEPRSPTCGSEGRGFEPRRSPSHRLVPADKGIVHKTTDTSLDTWELRDQGLLRCYSDVLLRESRRTSR